MISSDEEAEALLMGRDVEDIPEEDQQKAQEAEASASGGVSAALLDKSSKISFPIPGPSWAGDVQGGGGASSGVPERLAEEGPSSSFRPNLC